MRLPALTCCFLTLAIAPMTSAADKTEDHPIYGQTMKSLEGKPVDLAKYRGKVLLIVNTASECGATPQYEPLQGLHEKYSDKGLAVLGFPCNQFGAQEPGSSADIAQFCQANYGVGFEMFEKIDVNGGQAPPLYAHLISDEAGLDDTGKVRWNFEKFLIGKDGRVLKRFRTAVQPDSPEVIAAIEAALK
jgi:glutathione peroxidase